MTYVILYFIEGGLAGREPGENNQKLGLDQVVLLSLKCWKENMSKLHHYQVESDSK